MGDQKVRCAELQILQMKNFSMDYQEITFQYLHQGAANYFF